MRDPRDAGHTPAHTIQSCQCCDEYECSECGEPWPCPVVQEYDRKVEARERRKALPDDLDALTARVNELERKNDALRRDLRHVEDFIFGAALPVIRDLLATHATGELVIPSARTWIKDERVVESGMGTGPKFSANGRSYEYTATDGRVYKNGRVTKGANAWKATEQLKIGRGRNVRSTEW